MNSRGEELDPKAVERKKQAMVSELYMEAGQLDALTVIEFMAAVWDWNRSDPHWIAVLEEAGSICIWQCQSSESAASSTLGRGDKKLFANETNYAHLFRPNRTFEQIVQSRPVLLADVKFVIEHDDSKDRDRSPYYVHLGRERQHGQRRLTTAALAVVSRMIRRTTQRADTRRPSRRFPIQQRRQASDKRAGRNRDRHRRACRC